MSEFSDNVVIAISTLFAGSVGTTFFQYVRDRRLEKKNRNEDQSNADMTEALIPIKVQAGNLANLQEQVVLLGNINRQLAQENTRLGDDNLQMHERMRAKDARIAELELSANNMHERLVMMQGDLERMQRELAALKEGGQDDYRPTPSGKS